MKRFYKKVTIGGKGSSLTIELDSRPVLTPARSRLELPKRPLADQVAAEWAGQGAKVDLESMPFTRLAATAIDRIAPNRNPVIDQIIVHAKTDALCYHATEPAALAARQRQVWQPHLDWAAIAYDAPLHVTSGLVAADQPPAVISALRIAVDRLTAFELSALACAAAAAGSLVVSLALYEGRLDAAQAFEASHLEELYQVEKWGEEATAAARRAATRADLTVAAAFFRLLRD